MGTLSNELGQARPNSFITKNVNYISEKRQSKILRDNLLIHPRNDKIVNYSQH
jgi:hypothetical protein